MSRHRAAHLDHIGAVNPEWEPAWKSIRHFMDVRSFGANAAVADFGEQIVEPHTEASTGDEEVYLVLRGTARFTVDEAEFDAAAGALVRVEPAAFRAATAEADATAVLMLGGREGAVYVPPDWDGGGGPDPVHEGERPRPGHRDGYRMAHGGEIGSGTGWHPLGARLGVRSFGIQARAADEGEVAVEARDEAAAGAEVLYLVVSGEARLTVDGHTVDGPAGTFVLAEPGARRSAVSCADGTLLFAFDGHPGRPYAAATADAR